MSIHLIMMYAQKQTCLKPPLVAPEYSSATPSAMLEGIHGQVLGGDTQVDNHPCAFVACNQLRSILLSEQCVLCILYKRLTSSLACQSFLEAKQDNK